MSARSRLVAPAALAVAVVTPLTAGCAALDRSSHAASSTTFRIDTFKCAAPTVDSQVCQFLAYYGNVSKQSMQIDPAGTTVVDLTGNVAQPVVATAGADKAFTLAPGAQRGIAWSVTLPSTAKPARVTWQGTSVSVLLALAAPPASGSAASASAAAPSASTVPSTTPAVTTTTAAPTSTAPRTTLAAKPTTTKPKPTKITGKPTTTKPAPVTTKPTPTRTPVTTPPPVTRTTSRPPVVHHTTQAPTTNPTNPGGGSGGIG